MASSTRRELQGPKPPALKINKDSWKISKSSSSITPANSTDRRQQQQQPVVVYLHSPKVIHTKPQEFMRLVQQLTGKSSSSVSSFSPPAAPRSRTTVNSSSNEASRDNFNGRDHIMMNDSGAKIVHDQGGSSVEDPLILTLGQFAQTTPISAVPAMPSPVSPGFFLFSPNNRLYSNELSPLF